MTRLPIRPAPAAELTRLLADLYGWPAPAGPSCWTCSALSLATLAAGTVTCADLPCEDRPPSEGVAA